MHYDWWQATVKKETWLLRTAHIKQKRQWSATLTVVGLNNNMAVYIGFLESLNLRDLFSVGKKVENKYIQQKLVPLLQTEHGFCQENGPEHS